MRVLVTGSRGQLGSKVVELLEREPRFEVAAEDHASLDITRADVVEVAVRRIRPDWIINCAAFTDVERAETDPDLAFRVNDAAVGLLAGAAATGRARLIHVSTDYVFSGDFGGLPRKPYREEDAAEPVNAYGRSKLAGERRILGHPCRPIVLRTSWLYGGPGKNFYHSILRAGREAKDAGRPVRVVADQIGTPTDAWSLAVQIRRLLDEDLDGLFHAAAQGEASWFDFARAIFQLAGLDVGVEPIGMADYPLKARRPPYSVLENRRLERSGLNLLGRWEEGLARAWPLLAGAAR